MKRKRFFIGLLFFVYVVMAGMAAASEVDALLAPYETGKRDFKRTEIGKKIVYFHQRMVGNAIVEKDFIVYQFDKDTKKLLHKKEHWRDDIPEDPTYAAPVVTKKQAEAKAVGDVVFSQLYIISPESDIFPIKPTPNNPCWVVRSIQDGNTIVTIIDAVSGDVLGYGVPPPK